MPGPPRAREHCRHASDAAPAREVRRTTSRVACAGERPLPGPVYSVFPSALEVVHAPRIASTHEPNRTFRVAQLHASGAKFGATHTRLIATRRGPARE